MGTRPSTGGADRIGSLFGPLVGLLVLTGCAQTQQVDDNVLARAGFTKMAVSSTELQGMNLPPHQFARRQIDGEDVVLWYDPVGCNCVYRGTPETAVHFETISNRRTTDFDERVSLEHYLEN